MDRKKLSMIGAACGAVVFVALLMPFGSMSAPSGGFGAAIAKQGSPNGFDWGGGAVVLIFSLLGAAAALLVFLGKTDVVPLDAKQLLFVGMGGFNIAFLIVIIKFFDGDAWKTVETPLGSFGMSRGIGLWLLVLATAAGAVACFMAAKQPPIPDGGGDAGDDGD